MKINTDSVTDITSNSCILWGTIVDLEERAYQYGHYYAKTPNVIVSSSKTSFGKPIIKGSFSSEIKDLEPDSKYYFKAYLSDGKEPVYGKEVSFLTLPLTIPVYVSSVIENATPTILEMTYSLSLANVVPAASAFIVTVNSVNRTVSGVSINGTKVQLTLSSAIVNGDLVKVAYTKPATNPLQTATGGQAASITAKSVTNNVAQIPVYVSSVVENATPTILEMTYSLSLANVVPAASAFIVTINSVNRTVSGVSINGTKVQLTLSSAIVNGDLVTVAYTKPATNPLQTAAGGQVASSTVQNVTNNVGPAIPVYISSLVENATPTIIEITYSLSLTNVVPATSAFTVMVNSVNRTVIGVGINGTKVQLTLSGAIIYGDIVTVAYTKPATNPLQTATGGRAGSIAAQSVTNNIAQIPVYVSSVVENATPTILEMNYSLSLANIVPATSAFTVMVNSVNRTVSGVSINGTKIQLTLSSAIVYGDIVTVAYTKSGSNPLQTTSGGEAESISSQFVTNNCSTIPTITTTNITSITETTARSGGNVTNNGNATITVHGVCWRTNPNPTIDNNDGYTIDGTGTGSFFSNLTGLIANTTYYVRAYATNIVGTGYGEQFICKTATGIITDIDGNTYYTVTIGTQLWMKENLKTTRYNNGTNIPLITGIPDWGNITTPGYCWYDNDAGAYKDTYGALYNWYAADTGILCPLGWYVPSDAEWTILTDYLDGESVAGGRMKEAGYSHWFSPNNGADNSSGFTALPGGYRDFSGYFGDMRYYAHYHSSTENGSNSSWYRDLLWNDSMVHRYTNDNSKNYGFSVRCIKD